MIPVTLITGFLGSGKTTLASNLLKQDHGLRIAVLVNDFGSLNIDAALLGAVHNDIVALENGCICCSLAGGFHAAIARVLQRSPQPDCILVECSGTSDPLEVAAILRDPELARFAPLDGVLAVIDASNWSDLAGEAAWLAQRQVTAADIVLLNKEDLCSEAGLDRLEAELRQLVSAARIARTTGAELPFDAAFGLAGAANAAERAALKPAEIRPAFASITLVCEAPIPAHALQGFLGSLPPGVLRAKGIVELRERNETRFLVQATGRNAALSPWPSKEGTDSGSHLVLIGSCDAISFASDRWQELQAGWSELGVSF